MAKQGSRWKKGNERYDERARKAFERYRQPEGWVHGAKLASGKPITEQGRARRAKARHAS